MGHDRTANVLQQSELDEIAVCGERVATRLPTSTRPAADCPLAIDRTARTIRDVSTTCLRRCLMSWRRCPVRTQLCLLCLAVLSTTAGSSARAEDPSPDSTELARLIRQLGDTSFPR